MGKIIVIEGVDGVGKSTQFSNIKDYLEKQEDIISHHFPTYDELQGKLVIEYLQGAFGRPEDLSPYFINSLYAIDRKITWDNKLKKAYEDNKTILLDRYTTSSLVYQSAFIEDEQEKNKFIDYVLDYEYNKLGIKKPDKVIFLTAPFDLIMALKKKRNEESGEQISGDIHENDLEFMEKVYKSANYCAKYLGWTIIDCANGKKLKTIEEIKNEIINSL